MQPPADPFETQLEALFAEPPPAPDADTFALALEQRIAQESRRRAAVYVVCTAGAALLASAIYVLSGAFSGTLAALTRIAAEFNTAWLGAIAPAVAVLLVAWIVSELAPNPYRR